MPPCISRTYIMGYRILDRGDIPFDPIAKGTDFRYFIFLQKSSIRHKITIPTFSHMGVQNGYYFWGSKRAATLVVGCPFNVAVQTTIVCQNKLSDNTVKKEFFLSACAFLSQSCCSFSAMYGIITAKRLTSSAA